MLLKRLLLLALCSTLLLTACQGVLLTPAADVDCPLYSQPFPRPEPDYTGLVWISLVTVGLLVIGFAGFRRRDLAR